MLEWLKFILENLEKILSTFFSRRKEFDKRMQKLIQKERDANISNAKYNQAIFSHFVKRRFRDYDDGTVKLTIRQILAQIEGIGWDNLFLTGVSGMGKTTALKWLYLHVKLEKSPIFLYAVDFKDCATLDDFLRALLKGLSGKDYANLDDFLHIPSEGISNENKTKTVVFLDGLDELRCLRGVPEEFLLIAKFLKKLNSDEGGAYQFVISSRPEHFHFRQLSEVCGIRLTFT